MEESKASLSVATEEEEEEEKDFQIGDRTEKKTRVGEEHGNGSSEPPLNPTPLKVVVV